MAFCQLIKELQLHRISKLKISLSGLIKLSKCNKIQVKNHVFKFQFSQSSQKISQPSKGYRSTHITQNTVIKCLNSKTKSQSRTSLEVCVKFFDQIVDFISWIRIKFNTQFHYIFQIEDFINPSYDGEQLFRCEDVWRSSS